MNRPEDANPSGAALDPAEAGVSWVLTDQAQRWQRGQRPLAEEYLERFPRLRENPDDLLDLVYNEVFLRARHGESPSLEEYVERFVAQELQSARVA